MSQKLNHFNNRYLIERLSNTRADELIEFFNDVKEILKKIEDYHDFHMIAGERTEDQRQRIEDNNTHYLKAESYYFNTEITLNIKVIASRLVVYLNMKATLNGTNVGFSVIQNVYQDLVKIINYQELEDRI